MSKYVLIREEGQEVKPATCVEYDDKFAAYIDLWKTWHGMSAWDKVHIKALYVLESVDPDPEADNHLAGDVTAAAKYAGHYMICNCLGVLISFENAWADMEPDIVSDILDNYPTILDRQDYNAFYVLYSERHFQKYKKKFKWEEVNNYVNVRT